MNVNLKEFITYPLAEIGDAIAMDLACLAQRIHFTVFACAMILATLALLAGCLGYRYFKFAMGGVLAIAGFFVGAIILHILVAKGTVFARLPDFGDYLFGALFGLAFYSLGYKFKHAVFALAFGGACAYLSYQYISQKLFVVIAAGVACVVVAALLKKYIELPITAIFGGVAVVLFLGMAFPEAKLLQGLFAGGRSVTALAVVSASFCLLIQLVSNYIGLWKKERATQKLADELADYE